MDVRCQYCDGAARVNFDHPDSLVTCDACGMNYPLNGGMDEAGSGQQADDQQGSAQEGRAGRYDPAFRQAVFQGRLTVKEAVKRGNRDAWAASVAKRFRLSIPLALQVADNRLTLRAALDRGSTAEGVAIEPAAAKTATSRPYGVVALVLVVLSLVVWGVGRQTADGHGSARSTSTRTERVPIRAGAPVLKSATTIRTDPKGEVTQIVGPDPRSVLQALCESDTRNPQRPTMRLEPGADVWTGHCDRGGAAFSFEIHKDATAERWIAGNGVDPIRTRQ